MANEARDYLMRQFETAWALTSYHLDGLTTEECLSITPSVPGRSHART
jgi:hypothetical protein